MLKLTHTTYKRNKLQNVTHSTIMFSDKRRKKKAAHNNQKEITLQCCGILKLNKTYPTALPSAITTTQYLH
jgi:hypothetical protein